MIASCRKQALGAHDVLTCTIIPSLVTQDLHAVPPEARSSRMTMRRISSSDQQGELTRPHPLPPLH